MTKVTVRPLSVLLSQALIAFERDYHRLRAGSAPSLAIWSNLLRVISGDGVDPRELPERARVSRRAIRMGLDRGRRQDWVAVEATSTPPRRKLVRLTQEGRAAREAGGRAVRRAERSWRARFRDEDVAALISSLRGLVGQLKLELPHYPAGYGFEDDSVTGGLHMESPPSSPDLPVHGEDWPVVRRGEGDTTRGVTLSGLLSQALMAFAIDYESQGRGTLETAANVLQAFGDAPVPLDRVPVVAGVTGSGRSRLERHDIVVVERDRAGRRIVRLTERGRRMRDAYEPLLAKVRRLWEEQYGDDVVAALESSLRTLEPRDGDDLPDHPSGTAWLRFPAA